MFGLGNMFGFCKNPEMNKADEKQDLLNKIQVTDVIKDMKVKNKMENEKVEEIKNEELEDAPQTVSEEPEVQPEPEKVEEEPKTEEPEEGIEPPTEEEKAGETEGQEEPKVEEPQLEEKVEEQPQPENEAESEQAVEVKVEEPIKVKEPKVEEEPQPEEELPPVEQPQDVKVVENSATVIVKEVSNESELLKKIQVLEAEKAEKELELQKMTLSKEIEKDYAGVPGKVEDKVDFIYEIQNSALSENAKKFILDSLQSLSIQNLKDCQEIGHEQEVVIDEKDNREKQIKDAMEKYNLTEGQAFLYVNGDKKLAEAKKASDKVRSKRK